MAGFRSFPNRPKATDDEEKQPFLPKPPPARIEAIDGKRSFLKQLKPSTVKKFGIASGALTVIGFFGNFCHTLVKACFGGSEPSILGVSVGPNNSGVVIGGNAGGNAASPAELESLLREARKSLESRRKDEHRSSREGMEIAAAAS